MAEPSRKARDPWLDNAKMALVTLVVVGHAWRLLPHNAFDYYLYAFLYSWHMPAFVFVSGYLSRSFTWRRDRMWHLVRVTVVPYLIFSALIALFRIHAGGEYLEDVILNPHWPMWYLAALFIWRLVTPLLRPLPAPVAVAVAVLISLLGGFWAPETFDLARAMGFLPFFVLGLVATDVRLEVLRRPWARPAALVVFAGIVGFTFLLHDVAGTSWLFYRSSYAALGIPDASAVLVRSMTLVAGVLGTWAFLAFVPRIDGWFTRMGAWTLVVYLFHGFAIRGIEYAGYGHWAAAHPLVSPLITTLIGIAVALAIAWEPLAQRLGHLADPFGYAEQCVTDAFVLHRTLVELESAAEPTEPTEPTEPDQPGEPEQRDPVAQDPTR